MTFTTVRIPRFARAKSGWAPSQVCPGDRSSSFAGQKSREASPGFSPQGRWQCSDLSCASEVMINEPIYIV